MVSVKRGGDFFHVFAGVHSAFLKEFSKCQIQIWQEIHTKEGVYIENNTWQNPYHMSYHPETSISAQGPLGPRDDIGRG